MAHDLWSTGFLLAGPVRSDKKWSDPQIRTGGEGVFILSNL